MMAKAELDDSIMRHKPKSSDCKDFPALHELDPEQGTLTINRSTSMPVPTTSVHK